MQAGSTRERPPHFRFEAIITQTQLDGLSDRKRLVALHAAAVGGDVSDHHGNRPAIWQYD